MTSIIFLLYLITAGEPASPERNLHEPSCRVVRAIQQPDDAMRRAWHWAACREYGIIRRAAQRPTFVREAMSRISWRAPAS